MLLKPNCVLGSRATAMTEFRLLTGHECLYAYLLRYVSGQVISAAHSVVGSALKNDCILKTNTTNVDTNSHRTKLRPIMISKAVTELGQRIRVSNVFWIPFPIQQKFST
ncbi:hypothetical protein TNCV_1914221 [Trichonephila clavipes]|nr:hypothetical protein TNCV_1914221 [Trichonephila clavipes]